MPRPRSPSKTPRPAPLPGATDALERAAGAHLGKLVIGVDEVGRGPLAGPVTAAAAWIDLATLPPAARALIADSKTLSEPRRAAVLRAVASHARTAVAWASVEEIDRPNIPHAALLALALRRRHHVVVVDNLDVPSTL